MVNMITQNHKISYHIITIIWMYYIFIYIYIHWVLMTSKAWLRCTLIGQSKLHHLSQCRSSQAKWHFAGFYSSHRSSPHFKTFKSDLSATTTRQPWFWWDSKYIVATSWLNVTQRGKVEKLSASCRNSNGFTMIDTFWTAFAPHHVMPLPALQGYSRWRMEN